VTEYPKRNLEIQFAAGSLRGFLTMSLTPRPPEHPAEQNKLLLNSFRFSIGLKGLHSLIESITGFALFVMPQRAFNAVAWWLANLDLSWDPHDLIATSLRRSVDSLAGDGRHFAEVYLLSHGLVKLVLVVELFRNRLWAYPLMIVMLTAFIVYQAYRFSLTHSPTMIVLTIFDVIVIALTWMEYLEQQRLRAQR
jgi:uncharacterized membrane protein